MMLLSSCMQEEEGWPGLYYWPRPSKRDVLLLATVAAVLRETAKSTQAAIVMPTVIISKTAVMISQQLAATVSVYIL